MSLSKVIKTVLKKAASSDQNSGVHGLLDQGDNSEFQTFDSLWAKNNDNISSMASEKVRKEMLKQEEDKIIAEAVAKGLEITKEAYAKGFEEGKKEGLASLRAEVVKVVGLLDVLQDERKSLYGQYEQDVVELVKAIVEKIVNHEVSVNPRVISACLKKSLSYVIENSLVKVRLNGNDFIRIKDASLDDPALLEGLIQLELIEDNSIAEGGCLLETEFGEVDATLENRKAQMYKAIDDFFIRSLADE